MKNNLPCHIDLWMVNLLTTYANALNLTIDKPTLPIMSDLSNAYSNPYNSNHKNVFSNQFNMLTLNTSDILHYITSDFNDV